jgi:hypothetical protein
MQSSIVVERPGFVPAPAAMLAPVSMSAPGTLEAVMPPITVCGEPWVPMAAAHVATSAIKAAAFPEAMTATPMPTATTATVATATVVAMLR